MLGAIYGDKAGSIHEYGQIKTIKPVQTFFRIDTTLHYFLISFYLTSLQTYDI